MYIMTKNGWQPLYEPLPTWVLIGTTNVDSKRKGMRHVFEYFRGHYTDAVKRAKLLSKWNDCDVRPYRNGKEA
jgi:hypothetical protein